MQKIGSFSTLLSFPADRCVPSRFREQIDALRSLCPQASREAAANFVTRTSHFKANEGVRKIQDLLRELLAAPRLIIMMTTP
jgi:hypothetical protein